MRRAACILAFGFILLAASTAASAQSSNPVIQGGVQGIELCPQFICGAAIFSGVFQGQVGGNHNAVGIITAVMTHGDLPSVENNFTPAPIFYGGTWELRTLTRRIRGKVLGGLITYKGDNMFDIQILLNVESPGTSGLVAFVGVLDHNTLIPTFGGNLVQIP